MLGAAIRIAQRMGIHTEAANSKHNALEAELRRRLWWSLILFDTRISEMTEFKMGMLLPTWDCKVPLNVNDFDLRAEMKSPPAVYSISSEALFATMRGEVNDFTRNCAFHLDFINPVLNSIARRASKGPNADANELDTLERVVEEKYLNACDPDNPLHFMTIWTARGYVAKSRFVQHLSASSRSTEPQTDAQREVGISYALRMLECDTKLMAAEAIKGFRWLVFLHFPFPAYVHLVQELRARPLRPDSTRCWEIMSANCTARFMDIENQDNPMERKDNPFFKIFAGVVIQAWTAREDAIAKLGGGGGQQQHVETPPMIITQVRKRLEFLRLDEQQRRQASSNENSAMGTPGSNNLAMPEPMALGGFNSFYNMGGDMSFNNTGSGLFPMVPAHSQASPVGFDVHQWGWPAQNWNSMLGHGW